MTMGEKVTEILKALARQPSDSKPKIRLMGIQAKLIADELLSAVDVQWVERMLKTVRGTAIQHVPIAVVAAQPVKNLLPANAFGIYCGALPLRPPGRA